MPRKPSKRKFLLTINNPVDHGFTHERIRAILSDFPGVIYWCMCDEIGLETKTLHTHLYVVFKNSVMFDTIHNRFYGVRIDECQGNNSQCRDYVRKEGKYLDDPKHDTNLPDTFEEWGELPPDRTKSETQAEQIMQMVIDGKTNAEILKQIPGAYSKLNYIEQARQTFLADEFMDKYCKRDVTYLWGDTRVGKTRSVMDKYGYRQVYQVTDYSHPFDNYSGQGIIIFEEFRSSLKIEDMLKYLDGHPVMLPCRYANKVACYTQVYLISNIPLEKQYTNIQLDCPKTWDAFLARIDHVEHMTKQFEELPDDPDFDPDSIFGNMGVV